MRLRFYINDSEPVVLDISNSIHILTIGFSFTGAGASINRNTGGDITEVHATGARLFTESAGKTFRPSRALGST